MNSKNRVDEQPILLRIRDAAAMLAVSERSVWQLVHTGELPAIHPPGMRAIASRGTMVTIWWSAGTIASSPPARIHEDPQALQP